jgi:iron(III) transport system permease protein
MKSSTSLNTTNLQVSLPRKQWYSFNFMKMLYLFMLLVVSYIVLVPMVILLYSSVGSTKGTLPFEQLTFSLDNYISVLTNPLTYSLLGNTVVFTVGSILVGITTAVFLAWVLERTNFPGRIIVFSLVMIPMAIPQMIYAIGWLQLLNPTNGIINVPLQALFGLEKGPFNIYSLSGMIIVQGISMVPTAFLMIAATFSTLDPTLEEQSAVCGHGIGSTVRRVTFPILMPALLSATIFFTIVAMETFEIPGTIGLTAGIPLLSSQIYFATHPPSGLPDYGLASVLGVLMLLFAFVLIWFYQRVTKNAEKYATITGKGYRPSKINLGKWKIPTIIAVWGFVIISVILPLLSLIWSSLHSWTVPISWESIKSSSFKAYSDVLNSPGIGEITWNTLVMSIGSGIATFILVGMVSWMVVRGPFSPRAKRLLDTVAFLPLAIPGVVIGLSLMFFYIYFPIPIYGTIWVMIIGMVTKYIAFGQRTMVSAQMQISKDLEEASQLAGAGFFRTIRKISVPLISPALFYIFIWVVVHAMRELPVLVMLYSPSTLVASTLVWSFWEEGSMAKASVVGVFLIVAFGLLFYCSKWLFDRLMNSGIKTKF